MKATAQNQDLLFKEQDLTIIEELSLGDNKMRLVASPSGKSTYIQLWSSLSKQWNTNCRYEVEENWNSWKSLCHRIQSETKLPKKNGTSSAAGTSSKKSSKKTPTSRKRSHRQKS